MIRSRLLGAIAVLVLANGSGQQSAIAADPPVSDRGATTSAGLPLNPTATCPEDALAELNKAIEFVRGRTWTGRPESHALNIAPDVHTCRVVLHIGPLTDEEEAVLQAGAGSRLAIEYRRDWARPSRLLLALWIVFGGSGVIWIYRRYCR
ncbi:MAG TPA: hypothetical protein VJS45_07560 [Acidimicrobiia bacterium]|nr:hypothetical protein [Acidimicrobiia bacterium]